MKSRPRINANPLSCRPRNRKTPGDMAETIQSRAAALLAFPDNAPVSERLAACRQFLKEEMDALHARHAGGASGLEIARGRAEIVDALIARLFDCASKSYDRADKSPTAVALVALGGYGRGELSPWSDIDLMFLFRPRPSPPRSTPIRSTSPGKSSTFSGTSASRTATRPGRWSRFLSTRARTCRPRPPCSRRA